MVYLNILGQGPLQLLYPIDLSMIFLVIVAYYNALIRFYWQSPMITGWNLLVTLLVYAGVRVFFIICQSVIKASQNLLIFWAWKHVPNFSKSAPLYQKYVLSLKSLSIPFGVVPVDHIFHRHFMFQTNIVAIDTLLISSLR